MTNIDLFQIFRKHLFFIAATFLLLSGCDRSSIGTNDYYPDSSQEYLFELNLPEIIVKTPENGTIIDSDIKEIEVTGRVEQGDNPISEFLVNGKTLEIKPDGTFNTTISLPDNESRFAGIELTAKDNRGYWKREYLTILKGETAFAKEYVRDAIGVCFKKSMTEWAVKSISPVVNKVFSREDLMERVSNQVAGVYFSISPLVPLELGPRLIVNSINALDYSEFRLDSLTLKSPLNETGSSAGLMAKFSLRGLEINATIEMRTPLDFVKKGMIKKDIKITITDYVDISADLRLNAPDRHTAKIDMVDMDVDISEMAITTDTVVLGGKSINIKGVISSVVNLVLSHGVDIMLDDVYIPLPEWPVNLGKINQLLDVMTVSLFQEQGPLDVDSILNADFSDINLSYGIGGFSGSINCFRASLDLTPLFENQDEAINLPPTISIDEALISSSGVDTDLAVAVSGNFLNRMAGAFSGIEPEFFIPGEHVLPMLLPDIELPDDTEVKIKLSTPPVLEFKDGKGLISASNIRVGLYIGSLDESGLQVSMAFNVKAIVDPDLFFRDGKAYLDFDPIFPEFEVVYLFDHMGVSRLVDLKEVIDVLAPKLIGVLKRALIIPLKISSNKITGLLPDFPLPEAMITIQDIRMDHGYVSVFLDVE